MGNDTYKIQLIVEALNRANSTFNEIKNGLKDPNPAIEKYPDQ